MVTPNSAISTAILRRITRLALPGMRGLGMCGFNGTSLLPGTAVLRYTICASDILYASFFPEMEDLDLALFRRAKSQRSCPLI